MDATTIIVIAGIGLAAWFLLTGGPGAYNPAAPPGTQSIGGNVAQAGQISTAVASQVQQQSAAGQNQTIGQLIGVGSTVATGVTAGILAPGAVGATAASIAGFATAGVAAVAGIAVILWQRHQLRMKNATDENSAWAVIYPDWASSIQQIISAYNAKTIDAPTCVAELNTLRALVFNDAVKFQGMPGIDWTAGNSGPGGIPIGMTSSQRIWQVQCGKHCTIGCCLFNGIVGPNTERAKALVSGQQVAIFATGSQQMVFTNSFTVPAIPAQPTYGFPGAPAFTLAVG